MKYLVTGCDGQLGGRIAKIMSEKVAPEALVVACPFPERLSEDKRAYWNKLGVDIRSANYDHKEEMVKSFSDIDRLIIISTITIGDIRRQQHRNAVDAAVEAGVKHITYTSYLGASDPRYQHVYVTPDHTYTESYIKDKLKDTDVNYNFMRNNFYLENIVAALPVLAMHSNYEWHTLAQDGKATCVPKDDSAKLAAALLLGKGEDNVAYTACGKEQVSIKQIIELINEISNVEFKYVPVDTEGMYAYAAALGIPRESTDDFSKSPFPWCATDIVTSEQCIRDGMFNVISDDIETVTGEERRSVRDLIEENKYVYQQKVGKWDDIK